MSCHEITSMPCSLGVTHYKGDTWKISVVVNDCDGDPIDVTQADVKIQIRKNPGDPVLLEFNIGDGIVITAPNVIDINKIVDIAAGTYRWDLQLIFNDGTVRTLFTGQFKIVTDITR
jgi:hypothetical protein